MPASRLLRLFGVSVVLLTSVGLVFRVFFWLVFRSTFVELQAGEVTLALAWGLRFDLALAAILSLLVAGCSGMLLWIEPMRGRAHWPLYLAIVAVTLMMGGDLMYFQDSGRHVSYEIFDTLTDAKSLLSTALIVHTQIFCGCVLLMGSAWLVTTRLVPWIQAEVTSHMSRGRSTLAGLGVLAFSVVAVRGGIHGVPMSPMTAYEIGNTQMAELALNGGYSGLHSAFNGKYVVTQVDLPELEPQAMAQARLASLYGSHVRETALDLQRLNVVVLLLESWPAIWMKSYGADVEPTPFFDSLQARGVSVDAMVAGGHRTTEGIFTTFCSQQNPLGQTVARSQLTAHSYRSLAQILSDLGWTTAFFQGSNKNTSSTGSFAQRLGFKESYGRADIRNRQWGANKWGTYDQDLYRFALAHMKQMEQPFLVGVNTNTTHDTALPDGVEPAFENARLSVLRFADDALEEFLGAYEADPDFGPTLFVLLADHTAGLNASAMAHYLIPFVLFSTDDSVPQRHIPHLVSQRDIAPTIVDILGGYVPEFTGSSLLDQEAPRFADYYHQGLLGWIENERIVEVGALTGGQITAFVRDGPLDIRREVPADEHHLRMARTALAFTRRSQACLFSGQTGSFFSFQEDPD